MTPHHRPPFVHANTSYSPSPSSSPSTTRHAGHEQYPPAPVPAPATFAPYRDHPSTSSLSLPNEKASLEGHYALLQHDQGQGASVVIQLNSPTPLSSSAFAVVAAGSNSREAGGGGRGTGPGTGSHRCRPSEEGWLGKALMVGWVVTTGMFLVATAFWRGELFSMLDSLSKSLAAQGLYGKALFGSLILLTTIPPLPLYSTLIVLSGYTFGVWQGFVLSYVASLSGAVVVFLVSRGWLRDVITKSLASSQTATSLLHLLPSNPHLLFLIRLAPYPYNLLNVILASSPTLTLQTYTTCTALSLLKLVLHTWIGAGIHDLSSMDLHDPSSQHPPPFPPSPPPRPPHHHHHHHYGWGGGNSSGGVGGGAEWDAWHEAEHRQHVKMYSTWAGIVLCVALGVYLTHMAKRAIRRAQAEQEEREGLPA